MVADCGNGIVNDDGILIVLLVLVVWLLAFEVMVIIMLFLVVKIMVLVCTNGISNSTAGVGGICVVG